jgi:hypothetical protein
MGSRVSVRLDDDTKEMLEAEAQAQAPDQRKLQTDAAVSVSQPNRAS